MEPHATGVMGHVNELNPVLYTEGSINMKYFQFKNNSGKYFMVQALQGWFYLFINLQFLMWFLGTVNSPPLIYNVDKQ